MQKIVLKDKTEHEILAGASLGGVTVVCNDFADLGAFTTALIKEGNLDQVNFKQDEQVTGEYSKLTLVSSIYFNVNIDKNSKVLASFALREKNSLEITIETMQADQLTQDGAIMELAGMIGGQA